MVAGAWFRIFFVLIGLVIATGCGDAGGRQVDGRYTNHEVGLAVKIPDSWHAVAERSETEVIFISRYPEGERRDVNRGVLIQALTGEKDAREFCGYVRDRLRLEWSQAGSESGTVEFSETTETTVDGKDAYRFLQTNEQSGDRALQRFNFVSHGGKVMILQEIYRSQADRDEIAAIMRSLNFFDPGDR